MTPEMLEILIGKYLDSEITPSEQRLLEAELERNPQAKELLGQLQHLHACSREVITSQIAGSERAAEDIFERAWQAYSKPSFRLIGKLGGHVRFATGLAAGLLIGLLLHFTLSSISQPQGETVPPSPVVQNTDHQAELERPVLQELMAEPAGNVLRNVDWYNFTDKDGNQWLIEGLREDIVRLAAYSGNL